MSIEPGTPPRAGTRALVIFGHAAGRAVEVLSESFSASWPSVTGRTMRVRVNRVEFADGSEQFIPSTYLLPIEMPRAPARRSA